MSKQKSTGRGAALTAGLFVVVVWVINLCVGLNMNLEERGVLGDMFGAANAAFSGLAFVGVIYAVFLQRAEVDAVREEMDGNRAMLEEQRRHLERQNSQTKKQMFDATFFQLLDLSRDLRSSVEYAGPSGNLLGDESAFLAMIMDFEQARQLENVPSTGCHHFGDVYERFIHPSAEYSVSPYFRVFYTMLRRVSEAVDLSSDEKIFYGNLLRSQLTSAELFVMALNGLASISGDFREFLIEFRMLKYLPPQQRQMLEGVGHEWGRAYPEVAFAGR